MYSEEFKKAFRLLNAKLATADLADLLKISAQEIRRIRRELGL